MKGLLAIGICGRSCSGKGEVCEAIANVNSEVFYLNSDVFFKNQTPCKFTRHNRNGDCWECSKSIWLDRLIDCVNTIKSGKGTVVKDRSAWTQHCDIGISVKDIGERKCLIVEGFLLFSQRKLTNLFDHRIFIDVSDENLKIRRLKRQNGEGEDYIDRVIIPVSKIFEDEQKRNADILINGNDEPNKVKKDVCRYINQILMQRKIDSTVSVAPTRLPWKVFPGDLLMDHLWHPINYDCLKAWLREHNEVLESGKEREGDHFRYRKNLSSSSYEIRLSRSYHMYRYYIV